MTGGVTYLAVHPDPHCSTDSTSTDFTSTSLLYYYSTMLLFWCYTPSAMQGNVQKRHSALDLPANQSEADPTTAKCRAALEPRGVLRQVLGLFVHYK